MLRIFCSRRCRQYSGPEYQKIQRGIRSLSEWYMAPLLYPDYVHAVFEEQVTRSIKSFEKCYDTFGNDIDVIHICGTDFGTQRGPFVNPDVFKEFYLPYYKKNERMDSRAYGMEDFETQLRVSSRYSSC